jgi:2-polyprenyl-3-methyl-5-hydroxy-6-metoxy-1,4-benzoquinol methylase
MTLTWEGTIKHIRKEPEYEQLVKDAYLSSDLKSNVERFGQSAEFLETLKLFKEYQPNAKNILDIGCGNGISAINFALQGFNVTAIEPDSDLSIGAGAIRTLKQTYNLNNIEIIESYAEDIDLEGKTFDIVYFRQSMHHANDLSQFIRTAASTLKKHGLLISVRDHVIFNEKDKDWFLNAHPLHKFYGGENAFTANEYKAAFLNAGLEIKKELKYFDSVINYSPWTESEINSLDQKVKEKRMNRLKQLVGWLSKLPFLFQLYNLYLNVKIGTELNEESIPGRMYSYINIKK